MLVGNKLDLVQENPGKRQVTADEARRLTDKHQNMTFIETSSVARLNVNEAFEILLHDIYS
jgi:GTPase SAR1 family protein